ncbi:putative mediator of RNA polymerase II transcription subunit 12 [Planococcus citri]|uniref:putative mediator of RNA polymerase II transcription subunit 12 n=1 Tax=Planococcus citri TaxID=170843 RepID=UPI0031F7CFF0
MEFYTEFFYMVLVLFVATSDVLCEKNTTDERVKRNNNEFHAHPVQSRKANDVKAFSPPSLNKLQPPSPTSQVRPHTRSKPIHVPPYAVKMEPLVQYSQRDPLYHDKEVQFNITSISEKHSKEDTFAESTNNFVDYSPHYGTPNFDHGYPPHHYYKEPEPIIEIIIKESNESLPAPPPVTTLPTPKPSKEPIQVFYVKYKKNPTAQYGKDEVIYEEPIPALTPVSTDIVESHPTEATYPTAPYTNPPPPSTTLRTIIRPDSEIYHGTGLKVTFGKHDEGISSYEHRSIEAQKRDSIDTPETSDFKPSSVDPEPPQTPTKHLLEQRQSQNDFVRFVNSNPEPPQSHSQPRPNSPHNIGLPLQFEDGSYEKPPPPTFNTNANHPQQRNVFPSQIPFRPQHTINFPTQNNEFTPFQHPGNNLQNTKQHSELSQPPFQHNANGKPSPQNPEFTPEVRQTHFQHPINVPQAKVYPRITHTQAILPQTPFSQGSPFAPQFPGQESSFGGNKHGFSASNDVTRLQLQKQNDPNKHNSAIPFSSQIQHHQQIPFRGDFSQFQNQKIQFQQPLLHQTPLHLQQQPQHLQPQPQHTQLQQQHIQPQPQPQHSQSQQQHIQPQSQHTQLQPQLAQPQAQHSSLQQQQQQQQQQQHAQLSQHTHLQPQHIQFQQQHAQLQLQHSPAQSQHPQSHSHQNQSPPSHQPLSLPPSYAQEKPLIDRPKYYDKQKPQTNQKPVLQRKPLDSEKYQTLDYLNQLQTEKPFSQRKPIDSEKFQSQDYLNQLQTEKPLLQRKPIDTEKFQLQDYFNQFQTERTESKPQQSVAQPNYKEVVSANRPRQPQKSTQTQQSTKNKNESPQFQDGQIYQSISQSEEHQILNQIEQYNSNTQQKPTQNQNIQYISSPQETFNFNKPPKQSFEQFTVYTTPKPATKKEKANVTYTVVTKPTVNKKEKNDTKNLPAALAALPAEVPDDLREQLLSSGILSNADIQILDYDKVGDIPIESLPPEALENLYGAGSAPVPSFAFPNTTKSVEMKVVRYNSTDPNIQSSYVQEDSTEVDPVVLNDSSYNRYLPLKVKGSQFPIPDSPLLKNKKITSVVVLAPVDYDYVQQQEQRKGKSVPQVHGVRFISGESLRTLVKSPTTDNFLNWIEKEKETPPHKQSVILLVTNSTNDDPTERTDKEIFMYDIPTGEISKLEGELSSAFVNVAESNAESEDLDNLSENSDGSTPVSKMTSIPVYGTMSEQFKTKSRPSS